MDSIHCLTVVASVALWCCLTGHLIIEASVSCEILSHPQESRHQFTGRGLYYQSADTFPSHHCHWCVIALFAFLAPNYNLVSGFLSNSGHSPCVYSQLIIFLTNYVSACLDIIINLGNSESLVVLNLILNSYTRFLHGTLSSVNTDLNVADARDY